MVEKVCLQVNDCSENNYICNEVYFNALKNNMNRSISGRYQVLNNKLISCMEDLIQYCLTYGIDIDIPKDYKVTELYNIIFATGDFESSGREYSTCHSSIVCSSSNKKYIENKFKIMCKCINKQSHTCLYKNYFCWHTEDFAHNQIIHSYNIDKSYIVERVVE